MSVWNTSNRGWTLTEALTALAAVALLLTVILPVLSNARDDARITQCADNLRQFGSAAISYSVDHKGVFLPHAIHDPDRDVEKHGPTPDVQWFSGDVIGNFIEGTALLTTSDPHLKPHSKKDPTPAGLGEGVFVCPSDTDEPARSYDFNIWASSLPATKAFEFRHGGVFFDSSARELSQLMLFADALGTLQTTKGWATDGRFGMYPVTPGLRFGGTAQYSDSGFQPVVRRFKGEDNIAGNLDYIRHADTNLDRSLPFGAVNIALADGQVKIFKHDELYIAEDVGRGRFTRSTLTVRWSPADPEIQNKLISE